MTMRLLVDRGQLAVFAADGACYACHNIALGNTVRLTTTTPLTLKSLTLHHLDSSWPNQP